MLRFSLTLLLPMMICCQSGSFTAEDSFADISKNYTVALDMNTGDWEPLCEKDNLEACGCYTQNDVCDLRCYKNDRYDCATVNIGTCHSDLIDNGTCDVGCVAIGLQDGLDCEGVVIDDVFPLALPPSGRKDSSQTTSVDPPNAHDLEVLNPLTGEAIDAILERNEEQCVCWPHSICENIPLDIPVTINYLKRNNKMALRLTSILETLNYLPRVLKNIIPIDQTLYANVFENMFHGKSEARFGDNELPDVFLEIEDGFLAPFTATITSEIATTEINCEVTYNLVSN